MWYVVPWILIPSLQEKRKIKQERKKEERKMIIHKP